MFLHAFTAAGIQVSQLCAQQLLFRALVVQAIDMKRHEGIEHVQGLFTVRPAGPPLMNALSKKMLGDFFKHFLLATKMMIQASGLKTRSMRQRSHGHGPEPLLGDQLARC
jgi:hypothetical protein